MKLCKALMIALLLSLLSLSAALAEFDAVPASRIQFTKPAGLDADVTISDGVLSIAIDTEDTDWEALLCTNYDVAMRKIILPLTVKSPFDQPGDYQYAFVRYNESNPPESIDGFFTQVLLDSTSENGEEACWPLEIASYVLSSQTVQPDTNYSRLSSYMLYRWDAPNSSSVYEKLKINITFTDSSMFSAKLHQTPAKRLTTGLVSSGQGFVPLDDAVMTTSIQDGSVLYEIADVSKIDTHTYKSLHTLVSVPEALLENGQLKADAWCRNSFMGNTDKLEIEGNSTTGYYVDLSLRLPTKKDRVESNPFSLSWGCGNETLETGSLEIRIVTGDPKPWPSYVADWKPVYKNSVDLSKYDMLKDTMDITYDPDTGILHFGMKGSALPNVDSLEHMNWKPVVKVPSEGAAAYSCQRITTSELYGSQFAAEWQAEMEEELNKPGNRRLIPAGTDTVTLKGSSLFTAYHPSTKGVSSAEAQEILAKQTVYLSADMTGENAGGAQVIYWYKNADDRAPFKIEYLIDTREEFALLQESKASPELGEEVTIPVFLIDSAHAKTNCHLIIRTYPQAGGQYIYYELQLIEREAGKPDAPVTLDPALTYRLHIPYPKGQGKNSEDVTFIIRHLNSKHEVTEVFDESGAGGIERTEDGLIITIKSLSPFELIWHSSEEAVNPAQLPDTGDAARLPLWLALALTSFAALAFLRRRLAHSA